MTDEKKDQLKTLFFIGLGSGVAIPFVMELSRVSGLLATIAITSLIGSFLHGFAEFGKNEGWQKFIMLHAPEFMLGLYIPVAWHEAQYPGLILLLDAGLIHLAIWKSSVHSRKFREAVAMASRLLENKPNWQMVYFALKIRGYNNVVDTVIKHLGEGKRISIGEVYKALPDFRKDVLAAAHTEIAEVQGQLYEHPQGVER